MMLDWLADKHGLEGAAEPVSGSSVRRTRPMPTASGRWSFGGSNGTADIAKAVLVAFQIRANRVTYRNAATK